jgi:hypothetical protein
MNPISRNEKIEVNKRMIGKIVLVLTDDKSPWKGMISEVMDEETFLVKDLLTKKEKTVDIFDIRGEEEDDL